MIQINGKKFIAAAQVERDYNLPTGNIRVDINRDKNRKKPKFKKDEYVKQGRDWFVCEKAIERIYTRRD